MAAETFDSTTILRRVRDQLEGVILSGWTGGPIPKDPASIALYVPITYTLRDTLSVISNMPYFPYESNIQKLASHALFGWAYSLAGAVVDREPYIADLWAELKWDREMVRATRRRQRETMFVEYLRTIETEIPSMISNRQWSTLEDEVRDIYRMATTAPRSLAEFCSSLAVRSPIIQGAVAALAANNRSVDDIVSWMEVRL